MHCDEVWRLISDADGQPVRSPRVRAHLRRCGACTAFAGAIPERRAQLRSLAPMLPSVAAGGILARALSAGATHGSDGAGLAGAGAGKAVGTAILAKVSAVGLAATAAVGVTVALRHHGPPAHRSSLATRSSRHAAPRPDSQTGAGGPTSLALPGLASMSDLLGAGHHSVVPVTPASPRRRAAAAHARAVHRASNSATPLAPAHGIGGWHHTATAGRSAGGASSQPETLRGLAPVATRGQKTPENRAGSSTPGRRGLRTGGGARPTRRPATGLASPTLPRAALR